MYFQHKIRYILQNSEQWFYKSMSCSIIFSKKNIENTYFDLRMYGNKIESQKEIKFLVNYTLLQ
ncbi:hypothetical protein BpHYR1_018606 [Brachionus plicatilis]|uniref:Uncharacterized protein n=1 Tax=Brachionus plicatilis TaxID=10195 RepID=A0A3M7R5X2_BRAPC|nr:hypothetical protein BpHYR1_018606 [Brachionus plicatilis]